MFIISNKYISQLVIYQILQTVAASYSLNVAYSFRQELTIEIQQAHSIPDKKILVHGIKNKF